MNLQKMAYKTGIIVNSLLIICSFAIALAKDVVEPSAGCTKCQPSIKFSSAKAKKFEVGNEIPTLPFKTKTSWAGLMPVEGPKVTNASLFYWLWTQDSVESEDLVIWFAGGPGCSSVQTGMMEESGPFLYRNAGHHNTTVNPYSWTKVANVLYVESPVGVSLSTGDSEESGSEDTAETFVSFLENFYEVFPELRSKKLWLSGVSWAGTLVPYVHQAVLKKNSTTIPKIRGSLIFDGLLTTHGVAEDLVAYQFAEKNQKIMKISDSDLASYKKQSDSCHLTDYVYKNLNYPPKGRLPDVQVSDKCDVWRDIASSISDNDIDVYNITGAPFSEEDYQAFSAIPNFFANPKVQAYIHSPAKSKVSRCIKNAYYDGKKNEDQSLPPDRTPNFQRPLLARMIEQSERYIIASGNHDFKLLTNGTALALQNLTWNNAQGFSKPPLTPLYDVDNKISGQFVTERNLSFVVVPNSGHFMVHDQPATALAALKQLLGKGDWSKKC